jgi:hypothetical protein
VGLAHFLSDGAGLYRSATRDDINEEYNQRNHEQQVNQTPANVTNKS